MAQRYFYGWNIVGAAIVIGFMADAIGARITLWAALFAQATAMI